MQFVSPLCKGTLIRRYQRFLADILLDSGEQITAHCPNSGALLGATTPGLTVWVSRVPLESNRRLRFTWELVQLEDTLVGVNTHRPNLLVEEWLRADKLDFFKGMRRYQREVKYGLSSRIDFLIEEKDGRLCYLEVKNVHHKEGNVALFPDSVTTRGAKQLRELIPLLQQGHRAMVLYVIQRPDIDYFDIARHIDPGYDQILKEAYEQGLQSVAYGCKITPTTIEMHKETPILR